MQVKCMWVPLSRSNSQNMVSVAAEDDLYCEYVCLFILACVLKFINTQKLAMKTIMVIITIDIIKMIVYGAWESFYLNDFHIFPREILFLYDAQNPGLLAFNR